MLRVWDQANKAAHTGPPLALAFPRSSPLWFIIGGAKSLICSSLDEHMDFYVVRAAGA
jgi:hypothetical protein